MADGIRVGIAVALTMLPAGAGAADWPPRDLDEPQARVALTAAWAEQHRSLHDLHDLQAAVGALGKVVAVELQNETPRIVLGWQGLAGNGRLRARVYGDGSFGSVITLAAGGTIVFNSFGAFVCPSCMPPVDACGRRPSWVPHDVHWDTFDCAHTLTGPQSLSGDER